MHRQQKQYASFKSLPSNDDTPKYTCLEIQDLETKNKILAENKIVCIYLWASWCDPCRIVSPIFAELSHHYNKPGHCLLAKENVDLDPNKDFQIRGIPLFVFYVKGKLLRNNDTSPVVVIGGNIEQVKQILDNLMVEFK